MKYLDVQVRIPVRENGDIKTKEQLTEAVQLKIGGIHDNTVLDINTDVLVDSLATISSIEMVETNDMLVKG